MVRVSGLTKYFSGFRAVQNISFTAQRGEILGFLGPNGAGKTTTLRILTGFLRATEGTASIEDFDIFRHPHEVRRRIGYLPETPPLYDNMTVRSYLKFVAKIKGVPRKHIAGALNRVLERCSLADVASRLIRHLSRGSRQRVGIAQALVHDPPVLILDEPTLGLDPRQVIDIRALIKQLGENRTVILSTHVLPEVSQICNRVVIINEGKIVVEKTLDDLTGESSLEEIFLHYISGESCESEITPDEEWSL